MGKLIRMFVLLGVLGGAGYAVYHFAFEAKPKPADATAAKPGQPGQGKPDDGSVPVVEKYGFTTETLNH